MTLISRIRKSPLTIRVPVTVVLLMVAVSAVISERVLNRLSRTQETYVQELASTYLDGVIASIAPSVLREDSWEIFDNIERLKPTAKDLRPIETVVTNTHGEVLASSNPLRHGTLQRLDTDFMSQFRSNRVAINSGTRSGYVRRDIVFQNQMIGTVYVEFDVSSLLHERRQILLTLLVTNAVFTAIFGLVGFITVKRMIRPMYVLETHLTDAAAGSAILIDESDFPKANAEATSVYRAYNALVQSENERQLLARRLAEEEKLASLGRLASGMAHEINNPLGGLMNAVDTLKLHGGRSSVRESSIDLIQRGLLGIREVVEAALATYRPERLNRPVTEQDFADLQLLVRPELRRKVQQLHFTFVGALIGESAWPAGPIRQAVLNLLLNAVAASPVGGMIGLAIEVLDGELIVAISDSGTGMPDGARATLVSNSHGKYSRVGDGIGLWIVREIIMDLGGSINIRSGYGQGATVVLSIPRKRSGISHAA